MDKQDKIFVSGVLVSLTLLICLGLYFVLVIEPEQESRQKELNNYCISKGYDKSISRYLGNYAGVDVVYCRKEVVTIDENGIADLNIISDAIVFKDGSDK